MFSFGQNSERHLQTLTPGLRAVLRTAIRIIDFSVIQGHRTPEEQMRLWKKGREAEGPVVTYIDGVEKKSTHNYWPSRGVDLAPYPIDWNNHEKTRARFYVLAGVIKAVAFFLRVPIRWGGDWDGDMDFHDQDFDDLGHFEEVIE